MKKPVILAAHTNANNSTPPYAQFDQAELDNMIATFKKAVDWTTPHVCSLRISALPDVQFVDDANGDDEWDDERDGDWEQSATDIGQFGATMIFVHRDSGHELFFEYNQSQE